MLGGEGAYNCPSCTDRPGCRGRAPVPGRWELCRHGRHTMHQQLTMIDHINLWMAS
jgi:hypothetical protein